MKTQNNWMYGNMIYVEGISRGGTKCKYEEKNIDTDKRTKYTEE